MSEFKNETCIGQVNISNEVISTIAGTATLEVDGVYGMSGNITGGLYEIMGRKNLSKGVTIEIEAEEVSIEVNVVIIFGYKVHEVSKEIQERIKNAVETMTGLSVTSVNVNVLGINTAKESGVN